MRCLRCCRWRQPWLTYLAVGLLMVYTGLVLNLSLHQLWTNQQDDKDHVTDHVVRKDFMALLGYTASLPPNVSMDLNKKRPDDASALLREFSDTSKHSDPNFRNSTFSKDNITQDVLLGFYNLNTTRSHLFDHTFMIKGHTICSGSDDVFLVIVVLSMHTHIETREAIRTTWGLSGQPQVWPGVGQLPDKVKLVFLLGRGKTRLHNLIVEQEDKMYGDIVQADFEDSYYNLTHKVITGVRWVSKFCPMAKYILKADEDVFVHIHNLVNVLKSKPERPNGVVYGHVLENATVLRRGRWAVKSSAYPFHFYPSYTCGNTYVISGNMAERVYRLAGYLTYMNIEDVFLTGIIRTMLGADIVNIPGFTHWYEDRPRPCEFKNTLRISATKVGEYLKTEIWKALKSNISNCYKIRTIEKPNVRPEVRHAYGQPVRDDHLYFNNTSGEFYIVHG